MTFCTSFPNESVNEELSIEYTRVIPEDLAIVLGPQRVEG